MGMTDQELRTRVQKAVDHKLSGVQDDPWLAQRVMNRAEEEKPVMKKKLSFSAVLVLVIIMLLGGTALAEAIHTDFFNRVFGNTTREDVTEHTESFDDGKGGTYETVFPERTFVAVDAEIAEALIGEQVMNCPITVQMNEHTLTILSAVRDQNAMVMEMTLACPSGEKALLYDSLSNEGKGACFAEDSDICFGVDYAADMICVDMKNSTDTCLHLYYYCIFMEALPEGESPVLNVMYADRPYIQASDSELKTDSIPIPADLVVHSLYFMAESREKVELSPFSMKVTQLTPAEGSVMIAADNPEGDLDPAGYIVLPDPDALKNIEVVYADGDVYTVLDRQQNVDNTVYLCGGLGEQAQDTALVLNRLVDTGKVIAVRINGVECIPGND